MKKKNIDEIVVHDNPVRVVRRYSRKNFAYDYTDKTVRGSFINQVLTGIYAALFIAGAFIPRVADNLSKITELMIGVFLISFGGWKTYQYLYNKKYPTQDECTDEKNERVEGGE